MRTLKALSRAHGGKYTVQSGMNPGEIRDYWLIMESFHAPTSGGITRSAQIHRSWAMQQQLAEGAWRTMPVYSLVYVTEGGGCFRDERHKADVPVSAGDVICLFPGIAHAYGPPPGERWNEINVEFSGPVFDAWMGPVCSIKATGPPPRFAACVVAPVFTMWCCRSQNAAPSKHCVMRDVWWH